VHPPVAGFHQLQPYTLTQTLRLPKTKFLQPPYKAMLKRIFDITFSGTALVLLSPLFFIVAWLIKKEDNGPVFYKGERIGLGGRPFRMYKFRTMVVNADKSGASSTAKDDPRITKIGSFLRKYKLDELPQLINVFRGEMSIVGPRPEVKKFTDLFSQEEKRILSVRPGITDWACIWNSDEGELLAGADDPDKVYMEKIRPTKIRLQLKYVRQHGLVTDLRIIYYTLLVILLGDKVKAKIPELAAITEKE